MVNEPVRSGLVSNVHSAAVKKIRSLRHRKGREEGGLFFAEGIHIVAEAVQAGAAIVQLVVAPSLLISRFALEVVESRRRAGVACLEVSEEVFKSLSAKEHPQGLAAVVRQHWSTLADVRYGSELCWVALSGVQDPGNLGTILRTCDAAGAAGVILVGHTTDPYDAEAVRASMGAIFSQRVVRAGLPQLAAWKEMQGFQIVGTSGAAPTDYRAAVYPPPLLLWMGSEQHGLSPGEMALCDATVRIPMVGRGDSLNLAVATGVVLYEIFNQRRATDAVIQV
ncbi:MAG: RNA methyltransferase [Caldilineaceae bacterium]|nr:RNA methyltransferase [Caldilineaceae bacterium]